MRVFFGALLGAIAIFVWGWIAWGILDLYGFTFKSLPSEQTVVPVLKTAISESGAYYFPGKPADMKDTVAMTAWEEKHKAGPIGIVLFRAHGAAPMHWSVLARGFAMYLAACLVLAGLMNALRLRTTAMRLGFAILVVSFGLLISHGMNWNWMMYPDKYSLALIVDGLIGWFLAGGLIAMIVRPRAAAAA